MKKIALVPAAGSGSRMASATPKQYLDLLGQPLIAHTLRALLGANVDQVAVVISAEDEWWASFDWATLLGTSLARLLVLRVGGDSRAESVMNGLLALDVPNDSWVLVHDAARPCLRSEQVNSMITQLEYDHVGGILAVPVADTLKVAQPGYDEHGRTQIARTTSRDGLWQAQTPQMFRRGELLAALQDALPKQVTEITDEASALERLGLAPKLIMGSPWNLKVTYPQDLVLAGLLLSAKTMD